MTRTIGILERRPGTNSIISNNSVNRERVPIVHPQYCSVEECGGFINDGGVACER